MGGPGEDAISSAEYFIGQWGPLLRDRDLVLIDQRGTGKSGALRCPLFDPKNPAVSLRELYPVARVERCAKELSSRTDLTQYTYPHLARDLEHERRTLGYGQLNLQSGSYGTRAAQVYLRMYPQKRANYLFRQHRASRRDYDADDGEIGRGRAQSTVRRMRSRRCVQRGVSRPGQGVQRRRAAAGGRQGAGRSRSRCRVVPFEDLSSVQLLRTCHG